MVSIAGGLLRVATSNYGKKCGFNLWIMLMKFVSGCLLVALGYSAMPFVKSLSTLWCSIRSCVRMSILDFGCVNLVVGDFLPSGASDTTYILY